MRLQNKAFLDEELRAFSTLRVSQFERNALPKFCVEARKRLNLILVYDPFMNHLSDDIDEQKRVFLRMNQSANKRDRESAIEQFRFHFAMIWCLYSDTVAVLHNTECKMNVSRIVRSVHKMLQQM